MRTKFLVIFFTIFVTMVQLRSGWDIASISQVSLASISILTLFAVFLIRKIVVKEKVDIAVNKKLSLSILFFLLILFLPTFWAFNQSLVTSAIPFFLVLSLLYVFIHISKIDKKSIFIAIVISTAIVSIIGVAQLLFNFSFYFQAAVPASVFVNKNIASQYCIIILPIAFYLFEQESRRELKMLFLFFLFAIFFFIIGAHSKAGYISLVLELIVLTFLIRNKKYPIRSIFIFKYSYQIFAVLILTVALLYIPSKRIAKKQELTTQFKIGELTSSLSGYGTAGVRLDIWANTLAMIVEKPMGVGLNNFQVFYPKYRNSISDEKKSNQFTSVRHTHNELLQLVSETGFLGVIAVLILITSIIKLILYSSTKTSLIIGVSLLGIVTNSMFSFPFHHPLHQLVIIILLAILSKDNSDSKKVTISNKLSFLLLLSIIIFFIFTIHHSYMRLKADYNYGISKKHTKNEEWDGALTHLNLTEKYSPNHPRTKLDKGAVLLQLNRPNDAFEILLKAIKELPYDVNVNYNIALALDDLGKSKEAIEMYKRTLDLFPQSIPAHNNIATQYVKQKRYKDAYLHIIKAIEIANSPAYKSQETVTLYLNAINLAPLSNVLLKKSYLNRALNLCITPNDSATVNNYIKSTAQKSSNQNPKRF
jgi:O-antigen ligase